MTPLRQKLIDEIQLHGFSIHTEDAYVRSVAGLAQFITALPIKSRTSRSKLISCIYCARRSWLAVSLIVAVSGLRFFYGRVLHRPTIAIEQALPRMKKPVRRPKVYSVQELEHFFECPQLNRKHRAMFMTTYAAGLRVSDRTLGSNIPPGTRSRSAMAIHTLEAAAIRPSASVVSPGLGRACSAPAVALTIGPNPKSANSGNTQRRAARAAACLTWLSILARLPLTSPSATLIWQSAKRIVSWRRA